MTKFNTYAAAAVALTASLTASAAVPTVDKLEMPVPVTQKTELGVSRTADGRMLAHANKGQRNMFRAEEEVTGPTTEVIESAEGRSVTYAKKMTGYVLSWLGVLYMDDTIATEIVWGEGNEVYLACPITATGYKSYIKATMEGNTITAELPQTLGWLENYGYGMDLYVVDLKEDGVNEETGEPVYWYFPNYEKTSITWTLGDDGSVTMEDLGEDGMLGGVWSDDQTWTGCGEINQYMTEFTQKPVEVPAGIVMEDWVIETGGEVGFVKVGVDEANAYIEMPAGLVKGNIEGDRIIIPQDQFLGMYSYYFIYSKCGVAEEGYLVLADPEAEYVFDYDAEGKIMVSADPNLYLVYNAALDRINPLGYYNDMSIYYKDDFSGTPADPSDLQWSDYYFENYGMYDFYFYLPAFSTEGDILYTPDLYYRIFVDGELYEFTPEEYGDLEGMEPMTEIPYNLSTGWEFYTSDGVKDVAFYIEGITTIGVQSVYKYNGVVTESNIVTLNLETGEETNSGVKGIEDVNTAVKETRMYDLTGARVDNPEKGIYLVEKVMEDGSVKTVKRVVR